MEPITVATAIKLLNIPEISKHLFDYLTTKNQNDYNKLNVALQAYGFTVQQLTNNIDIEKFIESYRNTKAIDASIFVIKDSKEFSDKEKYEKLNELHEKEKAQQFRGQVFTIFNKVVTILGIIVVLQVASLVVIRVITKTANLNYRQKRKLNHISYFLLPWPLNHCASSIYDYYNDLLESFNWHKLTSKKSQTQKKRLSILNK